MQACGVALRMHIKPWSCAYQLRRRGLTELAMPVATATAPAPWQRRRLSRPRPACLPAPGSSRLRRAHAASHSLPRRWHLRLGAPWRLSSSSEVGQSLASPPPPPPHDIRRPRWPERAAPPPPMPPPRPQWRWPRRRHRVSDLSEVLAGGGSEAAHQTTAATTAADGAAATPSRRSAAPSRHRRHSGCNSGTTDAHALAHRALWLRRPA